MVVAFVTLFMEMAATSNGNTFNVFHSQSGIEIVRDQLMFCCQVIAADGPRITPGMLLSGIFLSSTFIL